MVGRNEKQHKIEQASFDLLDRNNTEQKKCTTGTPLFYEGKPLDGVHMTLCCIPGDAVTPTGSSILNVLGTLPEMVQMIPVCFSKFGRATVIILKFMTREDEEQYRALDRCGISESPNQDERNFHVSIPINFQIHENGSRTYTVAFPDVTPEKFDYWEKVLDQLEFHPADDKELLKMSSHIYC